MAQIVKLRRSSISGQKPTNSHLQLGEIALNTTDGKAFLAVSGSLGESVQEFITTNASNTGSIYLSGSIKLQGDESISGSLLMTGSIINVDSISYNTGSNSNLYPGVRRWNSDAGTTELRLSGNNVTLQDGQEILYRVYNSTLSPITDGTPVTVIGTYQGHDSVEPAFAGGGDNTKYRVIGVATETINPAEFGFITRIGIIHDLNLSGFTLGEEVYLSQTEYGKLAHKEDLSISGRTIELGVVLDNSSTTGSLRLQIFNESGIQQNTSAEINTFTVNDTSTGIFNFGGITVATPTTFNVGTINGWIVDNATDPLKPYSKYVEYSGSNGLTTEYLTTSIATYLLLNESGSIVSQSNFPTSENRRRMIYLGKLIHSDKTTIRLAENTPDIMYSPLSQLREFLSPIRLINNGVSPTPDGANLSFSISGGYLHGFGVNYINDHYNPNVLYIPPQAVTTFQYRTQTGGTYTDVTTISPTYYDNNGVRTLIAGDPKQSTNQRIFLTSAGGILVQYGQTVYSKIEDAIAGIPSENFVTFPPIKENAILIGIVSLSIGATNLNDVTKAKFTLVGKFGETIGGTGGSISASDITLQNAYDNSTDPEIITNAILDGVTIKRGSSSDTDNLIVFKNGNDEIKSYVKATGDSLFNNSIFSGSIHVLGKITGSANFATLDNLPTLVSGSGQISFNGITDKPSLVSGSSQVSYTELSNIPVGIISGAAQLPAGTVSGSSQVSFTGITDKPTLVSGSSQVSFTGLTDKPTLVSGSSQVSFTGLSSIPAGIVSGSSQVSYTGLSNIPVGIISGAAQLPAGTVSGSSQVSFTGITDKPTLVSGSVQVDITQTTGYSTFSSSIASTDSTQNGRLSSIEGKTGSISDLNTYTGSNNTVIGTLQTATSSLNSFTSSIHGAIEVTGSNLTVKGDFLVKGTTTIIDSTTLDIKDNIIQLNGTGATNGGLVVRDATAPNTVSGSLLWDTTNDKWIAGQVGFEDEIVLLTKTQALTNKTINGTLNTLSNIPNTSLTNSSITIAGNSISLGGTITSATILSSTGVWSGSAQMPSGVVSGSSQISYTGLSGIPAGIVSGAVQVKSLLPAGTVSGSSQVSFTGITDKPTLVSGSSQVSYTGLSNIPVGIISGAAQLPAGTVSGSSQVSFNGITDKPTLVSGSGQISFNGITDKPTLVSGSSQVSYTGLSNIPVGIISGAAQLPAGTVSGSSQVSYTGLSGIPTGIISGAAQLPTGTVSGSSQVLNGTTIHSGSFFNGISVVSGSSQISFTGITDKPSLVSGSGQISFNGITDKPTLVSGSSQVSYTGLSSIPAGIVSGAVQVKSLLPAGTVSGSSQVSFTGITDKPTLVSGSVQVDITQTTGYSAFSSSISSSIGGLSSSIASTDSTQNGRLSSIEGKTGSISDLNTYTGSNNTVIGTLQTATSSLNSFTSSIHGAIEVTGSNLTVKGNFLVKGTTTIIDSTTLDIKDNIIQLNGTGATNGGLVVRDATVPNTVSGSLLWDTTNDKWIAGQVGFEQPIVLSTTFNSYGDSRYLQVTGGTLNGALTIVGALSGVTTLSASDNITTSGRLLAGNATDGVAIYRNDTYGDIIGINTSLSEYNDLRLRASLSDQMFLRTNGNVDIGYSTAQGSKFAVNGSGFFNGNVSISSTGNLLFVVQGNETGSGIYWKKDQSPFVSSAAIVPFYDGQSYNRKGIGFYTGDFEDFTTESVLRMVILRNGNVGIGYTTDQGYKLAVDGSGYFNGALTIVGALSGATTISASGVISTRSEYAILRKDTFTQAGALFSAAGDLTLDMYNVGAVLNFTAGSGAATFTSSVSATSFISGGNAVLHAGNYSSYALPLSGGTLSGDLTTKSFWSGQDGTGIYFEARGTYAVNGLRLQHPKTGGGYNQLLINGTNNQLLYNGSQLLSTANYSSYALPLSGGTLTSSNSRVLALNSTSASETYITLRRNGTTMGGIGYYDPFGTYMQGGSKILYVNNTASYFYNGSTSYELIHAGNIGSQSVNYAASAGNADTLDGYHASSFVQNFGSNVNYIPKYATTSSIASSSWFIVGPTLRQEDSGSPLQYQDKIDLTNENSWHLKLKSYNYGSGYAYILSLIDPNFNSGAEADILSIDRGNVGVGYMGRSEKFAVNGSGYFNGTLKIESGTLSSKTSANSPVTLYTLSTSSGTTIIMDYTIINAGGTAQRSGTLVCNFNSSSITYNETSTSDLGTSTSAVKMVPVISGGNVLVQSTITGTDTWTIKTSIRYF